MFERVDADGTPVGGAAGSGGGGAGGEDAVAAAVACLAAGVERADPARATREAVELNDEEGVLRVGGESLALDGVSRVVVLGGGKGSDRVAAALVDALDGRVDDGAVVVDEPATTADTGPVTVREGDHPVPAERGVDAAGAVRGLAEGADASTLVLAVVTGGASALLPAPVDDVGLEGVRSVTRDLLDAGASIGEVNAVRKHVSTLKGGRLAAAAAPARVATIAVSDVVGDDPGVVGSGPTVPDASTFADAVAVLDRHGVDAPAVRAHLSRGVDGAVPETPGSDDPAFDGTSYHVVASARTAVEGAVAAARDRGLDPCVLSTTVTGEASEAGRLHAAVVREAATAGDPVEPPAAIVSAGETTVTVTGDGDGGPNQEFALGAAVELADGPAAWRDDGAVAAAVAAVDTDGRDGSTDAAGGVLAGDALLDGEGSDAGEGVAAAREALDRKGAYGFLGARSALLSSGATGTNVNDLRVAVVLPSDRESADR